MFNSQYKREYEEAIKTLKDVMKKYKPFLENKAPLLTNEEIEASKKLDNAYQRWNEARKKYFEENET